MKLIEKNSTQNINECGDKLLQTKEKVCRVRDTSLPRPRDRSVSRKRDSSQQRKSDFHQKDAIISVHL